MNAWKEKRMRKIFEFGVLIFFALPSLAGEISGRVVSIADGDTITVLTPQKRQVKVRLSEIDTPEKRQPYGSKAKQALSNLVFGQNVKVKVETTDRYGRTVGQVYIGGDWVNRAMVCGGHAWVYRKYAKSRSLYDCEREARLSKLGLWSLPEAQRTPPWEWRHASRNRNKRKSPSSSKTSFSGSNCGTKWYCKQMSSCAEARFYLENCGLSRLDGDGDGVPCESLCR
ncbi:MAG: thermonuclease family protein [Methylothermaceae bacterium]|nr:thermonuclease family protein [Methylothermaceae bacterium]